MTKVKRLIEIKVEKKLFPREQAPKADQVGKYIFSDELRQPSEKEVGMYWVLTKSAREKYESIFKTILDNMCKERGLVPIEYAYRDTKRDGVEYFLGMAVCNSTMKAKDIGLTDFKLSHKEKTKLINKVVNQTNEWNLTPIMDQEKI